MLFSICLIKDIKKVSIQNFINQDANCVCVRVFFWFGLPNFSITDKGDRKRMAYSFRSDNLHNEQLCRIDEINYAEIQKSDLIRHHISPLNISSHSFQELIKYSLPLSSDAPFCFCPAQRCFRWHCSDSDLPMTR